MALQSPHTNGATADPKPVEWSPLPAIDNTFVRDLKDGRTVVNRMLVADRAGARALVVELDWAGTLVEAMTEMRRLQLQMELASQLVGLAQLRLNAAIKMGPQPGERPARAKRRVA